MKILELKNIKKTYKSNSSTMQILNNISLSFERGEFVSILGESGCGKSTLMNIIGGMDSDFEGDVLIYQNSLRKMSEHQLDNYRKTKIGFIFQNFNLIPHLSVLDNITLAMEMMDLSNEERIHKSVKLLKEVGLEKYIHKKPNQLSGGQKQRVAIARALANEADIILAYEPTGALDKNTTFQILELLNKIAKKGKLVIVVTHSKQVADFGTRVISLEDGAVISDVKIKENFNNKEIKCIDMNTATEEDLIELYGDLSSTKAKDLNINSCIKLAIRNMKLNLKRNILVSFGSAIGICSLILMLSIGAGINDYILSEINSATNPKVIEISKSSDIENSNQKEVVSLEKIDIEKAKAVRNVERVEPVVKNMNTKITNIEDNKTTDLYILSTVNNSITDDTIIAGREPKEGEIMLSPLAIKTLFNTDEYYQILDKKVKVIITELNNNNEYIFIEDEMTISGVYDIDNPLVQVSIGITNYKGLSKMYAKEGLELKPTQLDVYAFSEQYVDNIKERLSDMGYNNSQTVLMVEKLSEILDVITTLFVGISIISLAVYGVMVLVISYINIIERTKEIGILRAIGARKKDIKNIFIVESALLGLFSGIFAIVGSVLMANIGNYFLIEKFNSPMINISFKYLLIGLSISILVSIIAGLIPSTKASKLDIVESLRY